MAGDRQGSKHATLTLTGAAQLLTTAITPRGIIKTLMLHADAGNTHIINVGDGDSADTFDATDFGFRIESPAAGIPAAPTILEAANFNLSDIRVLGTLNEKLHIMVFYA